MEPVLKPFWWKFGRPADLWIKNLDLIEKIIKAEKLKPVGKEHTAHMNALGPVTPKAGTAIRNPEIFGGMRMPHLHFKGDIFLLNDKQWKDFSATMIKEFQTKLSSAKSISFEQALELSESINSIV